MERDVSESLMLRTGCALHYADANGDARLMQKLTFRVDPAITAVSLRFHVRRRIAACHIALAQDGSSKVTYIGLLGADDMPFKVTIDAVDRSVTLRRKPGVGPVQILFRDQSAPVHRAVPLVSGPTWEKSDRTAASDAADIARLCASIASRHDHAPVLISSALPQIRTPDRSDLATKVLGALADSQSDDTLPLALTLLLAARG